MDVAVLPHALPCIRLGQNVPGLILEYEHEAQVVTVACDFYQIIPSIM
jgi:hypothetical protein